MNKGRLLRVIGSVFDAEFEPAQIPAVFHAVQVVGNLGDGRSSLLVRCSSTLGRAVSG
ncbi:MAG: hypothetical protein QHH07_10710 [Sedimentisphaerales bacterium]|jgi:F0F1-type ATP synthase beta subunit|nr:hypothetical protein [Sedimentisphaerales bacterium]